MDFVFCFFFFNVNEVVVDDDVEELNSACGEEILSKGIYEI
jgi:hypothetical protein